MTESFGPILYYTEYLPRINSVIVSFQILTKEIAIGEVLLPSPVLLRLEFNNNSHVLIDLPREVYHPYNKISKSFIKYDKEQDCYTLKLNITDNEHELNSRSLNYFMTLNSHYKWNAKYLQDIRRAGDTFKLSCSNCDHEVINSNAIKNINELPSEIWSELMEFWHCHKPDESSNCTSISANKYSILRPSKDSLNVGLYYFSMNKEDAFKKRLKIDIEDVVFDKGVNLVRCSSCNAILGELNFKTNLIKLNKWHLKLIQADSQNNISEELFHSYYFAYSLIIDLINTTASRVFCIVNIDKINKTQPKAASSSLKVPEKIYIWILNTGIAASLTNLSVLRNCLKIYYSDNFNDLPIPNGLRASTMFETEEIELPEEVIKDFLNTLDEVNQNLPQNCKAVETWKMGLLPFERKNT